MGQSIGSWDKKTFFRNMRFKKLGFLVAGLYSSAPFGPVKLYKETFSDSLSRSVTPFKRL